VSLPGSLWARLRERALSSRYLRDVLWQASGSTAAQVLGVAAMPVLTRLYAPSDFAALTLFSQLVVGLSIVMTLRLEYLVMLPADASEAWSILRVVGWLGFGHVLILTPGLYLLPLHSEWVAQQGAISSWLWLVPVTAWIASMALGYQQIVQRGGDFRSSGSSEFLGRLAYVCCAIAGAAALPSIVGLMSSTVANGLAKLLWVVRSAGYRSVTLLRNSKATPSASIRRLALSTSLSNLISLVSGLAPMLFIGSAYGESALGQYGLVVSTLYLPSTLLGQAIGQVYYQRASQIHSSRQPFAGLLLQTSRSLAFIGAPIYGAIALAAPFLYPLVFGGNWADAGNLAQSLCLAAFASFISTPLDRTSLIVRAWWYLTTWHTLRALGVGLALWAAQAHRLPLESCVLLLAGVSASAYAVDWLASYAFARRSLEEAPPAGSPQQRRG